MTRLPKIDSGVTERLGRRRTWLLFLHLVLFIAAESALFTSHEAPVRWSVIVWFAWVALLTTLLARGGYISASQSVRDFLNDELTRSHRSTAVSWGFGTLVLTGLVGYVYCKLGGHPSLGQEVVRVAVDLGVALSLLVFTTLEWRAEHG